MVSHPFNQLTSSSAADAAGVVAEPPSDVFASVVPEVVSTPLLSLIQPHAVLSFFALLIPVLFVLFPSARKKPNIWCSVYPLKTDLCFPLYSFRTRCSSLRLPTSRTKSAARRSSRRWHPAIPGWIMSTSTVKSVVWSSTCAP